MRTDTYDQPNTLHFIQTANDRQSCPVALGDTRITMLRVDPLEEEIPAPILRARLEEEAPHFMQTILNLQLPSPDGRLRIPVIETESKLDAVEDSRHPVDIEVEEFVLDRCLVGEARQVPSVKVRDQFHEWRRQHSDSREIRPRDLHAALRKLNPKIVYGTKGARKGVITGLSLKS